MIIYLSGVLVFLVWTNLFASIRDELRRAANMASKQVRLSEDVNRMQAELLELTKQGAQQMDSLNKLRQN